MQSIIIELTSNHKKPRNIYLLIKACPLTRISSPDPEIFPNVLLTGDVFHAERVFLYCHGPTKHTVILVGSILQVF